MEEGKLGYAIKTGNYQFVADYLYCRHEVILPEKDLIDICKLSKKYNGWSDSSWDGWLRNRIPSHVWPRTCKPIPVEFTTAVLHVFFIWIEENDVMLSNLRRKEPATPDSVARSKIGKTPLVIAPIDSLAARVVK